ncbi:MAG: hypothetical protein U9Q05_00740 [Thermodesulfobacteriota bacterium]|nr:hypothetical protein [Thermodesulfobacteriota bacterium]
MYDSLYEKVKPLIYNGESGILIIHHEYGGKARVVLVEGLVEGVIIGELSGKAAVRTCAKWASISTVFLQDEKEKKEELIAVDTSKFLSIFEKAHKMIQKINSIVPGNDAAFKGDPRRVHKHKRYSPVDSKVMRLMDGKRNISRIVTESGFPELDVLISVYRLGSAGVARLLPAGSLITDEERVEFLSALTKRLMEFVGPAAEVLISDAFETLGHGPETLARKEISEIIESVVNPLDIDEKTSIVRWSMAYSNI